MANYFMKFVKHAPNKRFPQLTFQRYCTGDYVKKMIGNREIVGFGINGSPVYHDCVDFPMPAIRFREENDDDIRCLREKEKSDWKKLSKAEKKQLYRFSFCQTFAEFKAPDATWKLALGVGLWSTAIGIMISYFYYSFLYDDYPETFSYERKQAQLKRIIALEMNPVEGIASKWDYDKNKWK